MKISGVRAPPIARKTQGTRKRPAQQDGADRADGIQDAAPGHMVHHRAAGEERDKRHQRDEGQVLEQQDGEGIAPCAACHQVAFGQHRQHDGGGGEGKAEPQHDCAVPTDAGDTSAGRQDQARGDELRRTQPEHGAAHDPQALWPQFDPDQEQQHDDARADTVRDLLDIMDKAEAKRPDRHAGREIAEHAAEPQATGNRNEKNRRRE